MILHNVLTTDLKPGDVILWTVSLDYPENGRYETSDVVLTVKPDLSPGSVLSMVTAVTTFSDGQIHKHTFASGNRAEHPNVWRTDLRNL